MSRGVVAAMQFRLDHASIEVPHLGGAVSRLNRLLGLEVTVSPQAPERHGRIYLDRAYLEVAANPDLPAWDVTRFFLRFSDPTWLRAHLDGAGLGYHYQVYRGVDGRWDDVELDIADMPVPILVRRTAPAAVARDWPPPLDHPHRCGASTLAAVHVPVASIQQAADVYARLLAVELPRVFSGPEPGHLRAAFDLGSGTIVLREGDERPAVVLGVGSMELSRTVLSQVLPIDDEGVAWLDPSTTSNLRVGLVETRSIAAPPVDT